MEPASPLSGPTADFVAHSDQKLTAGGTGGPQQITLPAGQITHRHARSPPHRSKGSSSDRSIVSATS
jgi:hypothetical protein